MNDQLERPTYEQLIEENLRRAEEEAKRYAATPARFNILFMELEIQTEDGKQLLLGSHGDWICTCPFYTVWNTCSHSMAIDLLLKSFLPQSAEEIQP